MQEFASLTPENTVYKLVGPVLVKQDQTEAKQNVDTRLDFIKSEMYVVSVSCGFLYRAHAYYPRIENAWRGS